MNILFIQEFIYLQNTRVYRLAEQLKINSCNTYYATLRPYIDCRNKEAFTRGYTMCKDIEFQDAIDIIKAENIDVVVFYNLNKYFVDTNFYTKLMVYCQKENIIQTGIHYPVPCHKQPCILNMGDFIKYKKLPITEKVCDEILSLPVHPALLEPEIDYVCEKIKEFMEEK